MTCPPAALPPARTAASARAARAAASSEAARLIWAELASPPGPGIDIVELAIGRDRQFGRDELIAQFVDPSPQRLDIALLC